MEDAGGEEVKTCPAALVHLVDGGRDDPSPGPLCDDPLATDGFRASCEQHPVQDGHADGSLGLLGSEAAGSQPWSVVARIGSNIFNDLRAVKKRVPGSSQRRSYRNDRNLLPNLRALIIYASPALRLNT